MNAPQHIGEPAEQTGPAPQTSAGEPASAQQPVESAAERWPGAQAATEPVRHVPGQPTTAHVPVGRVPAQPAGPAPAESTAEHVPLEYLPAEGYVPSEPAAEHLPATVAALTAEDLVPARRRKLLSQVVAQVRTRGAGDLLRPSTLLRWLTDVLGEVAPHIPIRDLATLRRHHAGLDGELLAERLVRNAARATAAVGAAGGGLAAVEWVATPTLLSAPVLLAAETVAVVAIEVKLVGELHEVYRRPITGTAAQRAIALLQSWSQQRGFSPLTPGAGMAAVLGTTARKDLRDRLLRRYGRNMTTMGPLLTGAAVAGWLNRRATYALGERLRKDLAARPPRGITAD